MKFAYVQIVESLSERIENGELEPGDRLPSERSLSKQLGVSRMTVRHALDALVSNGLIFRKQGVGTFVAEPKLTQHADYLVGFSESIQETGMKPGAKVLSLEQVVASRRMAEKLQIDLGRLVFHIHRIRLANEQPIALENSYFPVDRFPGLEQKDLEQRSIYRIMEEDYGTQLKSAEQSLEPVVANEYETQTLLVEQGSPLMLVERVSYDAGGVPVEYARDVYRGDRTRFVSKSLVRL